MTAPRPSSTDSSGPSLRVPPWLFASLAMVWGGIVLGEHFVRLPVPVSLAVDEAGRALSAARGLTIGLVREHVAVVSCALLILVAAMTAGRALLSLLRVDALPVGERLLFGAALGFGALSYVALLLAAIGWLNAAAAWAVVGALAAAGIVRSVRAVWPHGRRRRVPKRPRLPFLDWLAIGALGLQAAVTLLGALAPLIFYDALAYHFSAPHLSMLNQRLMPMPDNLLAQMPATAGYLYELAVLLKSEIAAKVLCWLFGVGVAAAIGLFARRMSWPGVGLWAALIFVTLFHVGQAATAGGIDLLLTLFSVCSVLAFLIWLAEEGQPAPRPGAFPLLVLSAVFSGLAMATKYTGVLVPAALIATLLVTRWRSGTAGGRCLRSGAQFVLIAGLVVSPWLIRNAVLYGNPVAPFLPEVFSGADAAHAQGVQVFTGQAAQHDARSLQDWLALPWDITMGGVKNSRVFSPLFLFLGPLLLLFRTYPRSLRWAALFSGFFALGWVATSTAVRYLLPALPWTCLLLAYWAMHAGLGDRLRIAVKSLILACCVVGILVSFVVTSREGGWDVVLGAQDSQEYLGRSHNGSPHPSYGLYRWINAELPTTARVLLLGETRSFYLDRDFVASSVFDKNPLLDWAEHSASPEELAEAVRLQGITHVLLNPGEARRLQSHEMLKTTVDGKRTLQQFWRRHMREVGGFEELVGGRLVNRVTIHEVSSLDSGGEELPDSMARFLKTP